jgi:hypothetical protein
MKAARDLRNGRADRETGAWRTTVSERWARCNAITNGFGGRPQSDVGGPSSRDSVDKVENTCGAMSAATTTIARSEETVSMMKGRITGLKSARRSHSVHSPRVLRWGL